MILFFGFCHSIISCFKQQSSVLLNCYTLYILFVFLNMFFLLFCPHFHVASVFYSSLSFRFLLSKTPRKAVLFHEYQVSTGRFNKFVYLLATFSVSFMTTVSTCLSLLNYRPPMLRKYASCIVRDF